MIKNNNPFVYVIFYLVLAYPTEANAQWVEMNNGLYGGAIASMAVSGSNVFAGTYSGGVFLSTNNGNSWSPVNTGLTSTSVYSLAISGNNIFAGTNNGIFRSTNNGASWSPVNAGLTNVYSLAISGSNIFAGTWGGVFLSINNGNNWTAVNNGLTNINVVSLAISGSNIFAGTFYGGVFLSTNNGNSWSPVNIGLTSTYVQSLAINGNNIFAGTNGGVFLSTNNGNSWTADNTVLTNINVFSLTISGNNILAGTNGGVFLSTNNGLSWTAVNTGLTNIDVRAIAISGSNIFAGTYGQGVFLSNNNGNSWTAVNTGLTNIGVRAIGISGSNIFAGTYGRIFLSTNNGSSWSPVYIGTTGTYVYCFVINGSNIFAGTNSGVFLSTNNGNSWTAVNTGLTNIDVRAIATSGSNIFAGTTSGVFLSTNNGNSWTAVNTGLTNLAVISFAINGSNIFAGTNKGIFLSTNNGNSWTPVYSGLTNTFVQSLAISGNNIFAGTIGGIFLSTNDGNSWTMVNTGLTNIDVRALAISGSNIFAGTNGGAFLSTDNGDSWTAVNTGLTNINVQSLVISGSNIFVGTVGQGVFSRLMSDFPPSITGFTPTSASVGATVTINGSNFNTTDANFYTVKFNNTVATVTSSTSTSLTVIVPPGATTGKISVQRGSTTVLSPNEFLALPLSITSFTPGIGAAGSSVTINGTGFSSINANNSVSFNGVVATVTASTPTTLTASVPAGNTAGKITVTINGTTAISADDFGGTLSLTSFTPPSAQEGSSVTITGTGFSSTPTNQTVKFNNTVAAVTSSSLTSLTVAVPSGATTGKISVQRETATVLSGTEFLVLPLSITSISPEAGAYGSSVTIKGTGFSSNNTNNLVSFNGVIANVTNSSPTSITAIVPTNITTGKISITVAGETATSTTNFIITKLAINQFTYPEFFTIGESGVSVNIIVNDINEVQSVKINRRGITEDDSKIKSDAIPFTTNGNSINLSIPASYFLDPLGLYFWFSVTEKSGYDIPSESGNIYLKYLSTSNEQIIPDLSWGKSAANYTLISVPLVLANKPSPDVFAGLGKYDDRKWRLFSLDENIIVENPPLIETGQGYWFIMRDQKEINPGEGTVVKVTRETPYQMNLIQGWNLIGNPYNFSISWNDVLTHNKLPEEKLKIRQYLNGTLGAEPILNRYRGAFVYSDIERDIEIPVIIKSNGGRIASKTLAAIDEKEWQVDLTLEDGEFSSSLLGFGMNPKASENNDMWDEIALPILEGLSSFHFSLRTVLGKELIKDIVPTKENYTWQATISSDHGGTIHWDNSYFGNNDKKIVLELSDRVELYDMRTLTEIVIPKGSHILKFHFGNDDYIKSQVLESAIRIGNIYPNPIKRNEELLSISLSLPEGKNEIRLSLRNFYGNDPLLSGKGVYDGGRQAITWSNDFSQMPAGLYLLKIETINSNGLRLTEYRKIILE